MERQKGPSNMAVRGSLSGRVQVDQRSPGGKQPFEYLTVQLPDGGAVLTLADVAAKLGIELKSGDRLRISMTRTPAMTARRRK
jgi:hypothetical protein